MSEQTDKPMTPESRRYTAEELRRLRLEGLTSDGHKLLKGSPLDCALQQAAEDCAVLERLDAWLDTRNSIHFWSEPKETLWMMNEIANRLKREREDIRHGR